jgi:uncharacterized membrane protein
VPGLLTPEGPFWPLLDYFLDRQLARSLSWMSKVCLSVRLFLEYMQANECEQGRVLFSNFAKRLYSGTAEPATGLDPSGLYWQPRRSNNASGIITDCWRRSKFDPPCRLNFDPGLGAGIA